MNVGGLGSLPKGPPISPSFPYQVVSARSGLGYLEGKAAGVGTATRVSGVGFPPLAFLSGVRGWRGSWCWGCLPPRLLWSPARDAGADAAQLGVEEPLTASSFALTPAQIVQGFSNHPF